LWEGLVIAECDVGDKSVAAQTPRRRFAALSSIARDELSRGGSDPPARREPLRRGEGPDVFERYFGREPTPQEREHLQLDGGILEWWGD